MRGFPIEKSKAVMTRALDAMRGDDTFNLIAFAGHTAVLWDTPRPATLFSRDREGTRMRSRFWLGLIAAGCAGVWGCAAPGSAEMRDGRGDVARGNTTAVQQRQHAEEADTHARAEPEPQPAVEFSPSDWPCQRWPRRRISWLKNAE